MFEQFEEFLARFDQVIVVLTIVLGLLQCFLGYKLLKFWVAIIGFLAGFLLGFCVASAFITGNSYIPAGIGVVAGILIAFIAFKIYLVGVFFYCGVIAFSAAQAIPFPDTQTWDIVLIVIGLIAFVVVGILGVKFARPCIIISTAVSGGAQAIRALSTPVPALGENEVLFLVISLALAALGIAIQFATTKERG